jgi:hypothetical protein
MGTVKLGISGLSDTALVIKGRTCYDMCKGNEAFNLPDGFLDSLKEASDKLAQLEDQATFFGGRILHQQKRVAATTLRALIKELGGFVQAQSKGDPGIILSGGFQVRKGGSPVEQLGNVQNFRPLLSNFEGDVLLRWNTVPYATNYQVFANSSDPLDPNGWELVAFTSQSRYTVEALESGKFYWFRVQALGRKGMKSPMSQTVRALAA